MARKPPALGDMRWSIQVVRRMTTTPTAFSAEVDHDYQPVLTTRAACRTLGGTSEFNQVVINGTKASHTFTFRFSTIPIDVRDRVQDTQRNLYQILAVEPWDENRRWMSLHCARVGTFDRPSVT